MVKDKDKEPIDLLKRRVEKLLEQERQKEATEEVRGQLEWSGGRFASTIQSIELSEEVLRGVKCFMCTIANKVREADSIDQVKRSCFGLALLLLRDYDHVAFDKLLKMLKDEMQKD